MITLKNKKTGSKVFFKKINESWRVPFSSQWKIFEEGMNKGYSEKLYKKLINTLENPANQKSKNRREISITRLTTAQHLWKNFNIDEVENLIKQSKLPEEYKEEILEKFPKNIKQSLEAIEKIRSSSFKFPSKPYKLKEDTQNLFSMIPRQIYYAGIYWKQFNYEKGLDALIKKDKTGYYIYDAGIYWPQFDYEKGLDALIEKDKTGNYIYLAGIDWPQFNYEKGFKVLKKFPKYYEAALENWPKGIKETQKAIDELKKRSKKLPSKPYKLKEVYNIISTNIKSNIIETFELRRQKTLLKDFLNGQ